MLKKNKVIVNGEPKIEVVLVKKPPVIGSRPKQQHSHDYDHGWMNDLIQRALLAKPRARSSERSFLRGFLG
jgi:hypothetical protein